MGQGTIQQKIGPNGEKNGGKIWGIRKIEDIESQGNGETQNPEKNNEMCEDRGDTGMILEPWLWETENTGRMNTKSLEREGSDVGNYRDGVIFNDVTGDIQRLSRLTENKTNGEVRKRGPGVKDTTVKTDMFWDKTGAKSRRLGTKQAEGAKSRRLGTKQAEGAKGVHRSCLKTILLAIRIAILFNCIAQSIHQGSMNQLKRYIEAVWMAVLNTEVNEIMLNGRNDTPQEIQDDGRLWPKLYSLN